MHLHTDTHRCKIETTGDLSTILPRDTIIVDLEKELFMSINFSVDKTSRQL